MSLPTVAAVQKPPGIAIGPVVFPVEQDHTTRQVYAEIPGVGKVVAADLNALAAQVEGYLAGMAKKVERITQERRADELAKAKAKRDAARDAMRQKLDRDTAKAFQREALAYAFMALLFVSIAAPQSAPAATTAARQKLG